MMELSEPQFVVIPRLEYLLVRMGRYIEMIKTTLRVCMFLVGLALAMVCIGYVLAFFVARSEHVGSNFYGYCARKGCEDAPSN